VATWETATWETATWENGHVGNGHVDRNPHAALLNHCYAFVCDVINDNTIRTLVYTFFASEQLLQGLKNIFLIGKHDNLAKLYFWNKSMIV
jgi:hypothetical protein